MSVFNLVGTATGSGIVSVAGVADLQVVNWHGQWMLYSASATDYGLGAFRIGSNGALTAFDGLAYSGSSGTLGVTGLVALPTPTGTALMPLSAFEDRLALHAIDADGGFGAPHNVQGGVGTQMARAAAATSIDLGGGMVHYIANRSNGGFKGYSLDGALALSEITSRNDNAKAHLGDVQDMAAVSAYGKSFLFVTSAMDAGLSSYRLDKFGQTYSKHNIGPDDGIGINAPSAMTTVTTQGDLFLVLAGSGSDSLTVFRVSKQGVLRDKDHIVDDAHTRFDGVTALTSVEVNDRAFVLAGGADDGITLFELTPRSGKLKLWGVLEDTDGLTLADVTDIEALEVNGTLHLYVTSGHETGITHLTVDLGPVAAPIVGTKSAEVFEGTAQDDLILGMNGNDLLRGNAGDDWLSDGRGSDQLEGGDGADVFCFSVDRRPDTILDFTPGEDRIDLSEWPMLYAMDQLKFVEKDFGVVLVYGNERIRILSNDLGGDITVDDFTDADFLFG